MNKQEFLSALEKGLHGLPKNDVAERLSFYSEIIDDRIEEGLAEEDAIREIGDVNTIINQFISEIPIGKLAKEKIKSRRRLSAWETVLLILGSPIWLSLLIAAFAVVLALYVSLWAVLVSLWAVFVALVGCAFGGVFAGSLFFVAENKIAGIVTIGAGLACAGLSVFFFYVCKAATKGTLLLTKKIVLRLKNKLIVREEV